MLQLADLNLGVVGLEYRMVDCSTKGNDVCGTSSDSGYSNSGGSHDNSGSSGSDDSSGSAWNPSAEEFNQPQQQSSSGWGGW